MVVAKEAVYLTAAKVVMKQRARKSQKEAF